MAKGAVPHSFRDPKYIECLQNTNKEFPVLAKIYRAVVDYYDTVHEGDKERLRKDMRALKRRKFRVDWVDPLKRKRVAFPAFDIFKAIEIQERECAKASWLIENQKRALKAGRRVLAKRRAMMAK
jgi:hypothetical protein